MRVAMKKRKLILLAAVAALVAASVWAQSRVYWFNGVRYIFPASQGAAGKVLTNDGTGILSWATVVAPDSMWAGSVVMSSVACPAGWTRLAAADNRVLRGAAAAGGTGGADTHGHTLSGATDSQGVTITGNTAGSGVTITGNTGSTSISHTHGVTQNTTTAAAGGTSVVTSVTVNAGDASHSHAAGTLSGDSHSHAKGTLAGAAHTHGGGSVAAASASNLPAYYGVIVCVKD
jgi:hypothetical protein